MSQTLQGGSDLLGTTVALWDAGSSCTCLGPWMEAEYCFTYTFKVSEQHTHFLCEKLADYKWSFLSLWRIVVGLEQSKEL
jgi:hypothetical protein